jgi:D-inositol-3-phosphate glycosyltransferase
MGEEVDAVPRRIGLISDHASPLVSPGSIDAGGQNVYVAEVARHLRALGHDVDVFTRRDDLMLPPIVTTPQGVRVIHVDAGPARPIPKEELLPFMRGFADVVQRVARVRSYDLLHANFWMSAAVAMDVRRTLGTPFVVTFHALGKIRRREQGDADGSPAARIALEERAVRTADRLIAECPQDEEDLISLYGADPGRVSVVPAGFEPTELSPGDRAGARRRIGVNAHVPLILHVGRLVPRKGIDDLIRGSAPVLAATPSARLLIVGGHPDDPASRRERDRLTSIASALGVARQVTFAGQVERERLRDHYRAADVFATTPWYEPFGITPVESMACGTPVIGADVGGISYTVLDGETGFLVPPRSPDAITDRLRWCLARPDAIAVMRPAARQRVHPRFAWSTIATEIADVYERTLELRTLEELLSEAPRASDVRRAALQDAS